MKNKFGETYQSKLAESSLKSQAEQGMGAIRGIQDYYGTSEKSAINKLALNSGRASYVQAQSTAQDMGMKDKHGGFERIALKSAAIQSAGQIADVKGFESNYGSKTAGVESYLSDSTQQARKKYASTHGAAKSIKRWGNAALAENAEFSEQSSIESAQAQIREGGNSAVSAAHKLARKSAADMRGLVDTQNTFDKVRGVGGYEEASALFAQKSATDSLKMLSTDVESGLVDMKMVTTGKGKNKHQEARLDVSKIGGEAAYVSAKDKSTVARTQRDMSFDKNAADAQSKELDNLATLDKETMVQSGLAEYYQGEDGKQHVRATVGYGKAAALSQQKAGNIFGLQGATLADGSTLKMFVGKNAINGEYTARVADYDKGSREQIGRGVVVSPGSNALYHGMKQSRDGAAEGLEKFANKDEAEASKEATDGVTGLVETGAVLLGALGMEWGAGKILPKKAYKQDGHFRDKQGNRVHQSESGTFHKEANAKNVSPNEKGEMADKNGDKVFKGDDGKFYYEEAMDKAKLDKKDMGPLERGIRGALNRGDSDGFKTTSKPSGGSFDKTNNISDNDPHHSESKQSDNISKHNTPPSGESSTGSNPSNTNNSITNSKSPQGHLNAETQKLNKLKGKHEINEELLSNTQNASNADLGKEALVQKLDTKAKEALGKFDAGEISADDYKQRIAGINAVKNQIASGGNVSMGSLKGAGIDFKEVIESGIPPKTVQTTGKDGKVNKSQVVDLFTFNVIGVILWYPYVTPQEKIMTTAPIHPGTILQDEFLEPYSLSQNALANAIGVSPRRINEIVNAKRSITADTALRLSIYFGTTPDFWLHLQSKYDLEITKESAWEKISSQVKARVA